MKPFSLRRRNVSFEPTTDPPTLRASDVIIEPLQDDLPGLETDGDNRFDASQKDGFRILNDFKEELRRDFGDNDIGLNANELVQMMLHASNQARASGATILAGGEDGEDVKPANYYQLSDEDLESVGSFFKMDTLDYINEALSDIRSSVGKSILNIGLPVDDAKGSRFEPTPAQLSKAQGDSASSTDETANNAHATSLKNAIVVDSKPSKTVIDVNLAASLKKTDGGKDAIRTSIKTVIDVMGANASYAKKLKEGNAQHVRYAKMTEEENTAYISNLGHYAGREMPGNARKAAATVKKYIADFEQAKIFDKSPHRLHFKKVWKEEQKKGHESKPREIVPEELQVTKKRVGLRLNIARKVLYSASTVIDLLALANIIPAPEGSV